jgi:hypothetical protein
MGPHEPTGQGYPKPGKALRSDEDVLAYARVVRAELRRTPQGAPGRDGLISEWRKACDELNARGLELD